MGMAYPRRLLNTGESIVLDLHPHWRFYAGPVAAFLAAVGVLVVLRTFQPDYWWVGAALLGLAALWLAVTYVRWVTTNFVLTSDRLIWRTGVFTKQGIDIPLERVNNITSNQPFFERLLGSGDLVIESAGEGGQQSFSDIARPGRVQNAIFVAMEAAAARDADRMAGRPGGSVADELRQLADLRDRGVLDSAEFERAKADVLGEPEPT